MPKRIPRMPRIQYAPPSDTQQQLANDYVVAGIEAIALGVAVRDTDSAKLLSAKMCVPSRLWAGGAMDKIDEAIQRLAALPSDSRTKHLQSVVDVLSKVISYSPVPHTIDWLVDDLAKA